VIDLYQRDCLEVMRALPSDSIDSIVTDPPYGISFMAKRWDYDVPGVDVWGEVLRVLKPGGHALVACGTRTQHRMVVNIEDAGFEIRDVVSWIYGSGFPKSLNIGKKDGRCPDGWGTALKPSCEFFTLARKPLSEKTVAKNVLKWGTGGINVDGCRVGTTREVPYSLSKCKDPNGFGPATGVGGHPGELNPNIGRFPANLIHDGSQQVLDLFPDRKGAVSNGRKGVDGACFGHYGATEQKEGYNDKGSAARFFYCAKASKKDRDENNHHPTVKPTALMRYLCKLITPPDGTVLDPYMGSGSTGKAAILEGFSFVGCELDEDYFKIAQSRIEGVASETALNGLRPKVLAI